ncbi:MAG: hypothetical protein ACRD08_16065, partial [Acidimicrobiales bacterium]
MAYNFLPGDRDQPFLLPPDLRDWLPADHLAWFVLDVVDQLDLGPFLHRRGHLRALREAPRGASGFNLVVGIDVTEWPPGQWGEAGAERFPELGPDHVRKRGAEAGRGEQGCFVRGAAGGAP